MRRFFIPTEQIDGDTAFIEGSDVAHIRNVLRKAVGDVISATDGHGSFLSASVVSIDGNKIKLKIFKRENVKERNISIRVYQAIPKGDKMELIIEKLTELGVNEIAPIITERTIPRYEGEKAEKKKLRWDKISIETMKAVGRAGKLEIMDIMSAEKIGSVLIPGALKIIPWELEYDLSLKTYLRKNMQNYKNAVSKIKSIEIVIGPEGGFNHKEYEMFKKMGFTGISLGERILKVETASIVCVGNIYYELE